MRSLVRFYKRGRHRVRKRHYAAVLHQSDCHWRKELGKPTTNDGHWELFDSAAEAEWFARAHARKRGLDDTAIIFQPKCC